MLGSLEVGSPISLCYLYHILLDIYCIKVLLVLLFLWLLVLILFSRCFCGVIFKVFLWSHFQGVSVESFSRCFCGVFSRSFLWSHFNIFLWCHLQQCSIRGSNRESIIQQTTATVQSLVKLITPSALREHCINSLLFSNSQLEFSFNSGRESLSSSTATVHIPSEAPFSISIEGIVYHISIVQQQSIREQLQFREGFSKPHLQLSYFTNLREGHPINSS